jgi:hypothetical protein
MSLRTLIGDILMKLTDAGSAPTEPLATDPLNYLLAQQLNNPGLNNPAREPAELQRRTRNAFPAISQAEYEAISQQLEAAQHLAFDLASAVNRQQLTQWEARERLGHAVPELNAANLSQLLIQNLVGTR